MDEDNVTQVIGLGKVGDHVTLKVFPPHDSDEYYFRWFYETGEWEYVEKDSNETASIHPDNVKQLIGFAREYL